MATSGDFALALFSEAVYNRPGNIGGNILGLAIFTAMNNIEENLKGKIMKIKAIVLYILLILTWYYHSGCIQTKSYKWEPTEEQKEEMAERAAKKMIEMQEKAEK